jgi:hypothetical protein
MRRPLLAMSALVLLPSIVTLAPRAATPPGPYAVTDLGIFNNVQSAHANDVNEAGQVVGYAASRAFIRCAARAGVRMMCRPTKCIPTLT